jgi:methyl-accepting chemotaxis protein
MFGTSQRFVTQLSESNARSTALENELNAIKKNIGYIEFTPTGEILDANDLFLKVTGYQLPEIQGKHHRMFCDSGHIRSPEYAEFWENLRAGKSQKGTFQRFAKDGHSIWLEASYFPVTVNNLVVKVVKIASDITHAKNALQDRNSLFEALDKSLAVIEFDPMGNIITANQNFLSTIGYTLSEISGKHHRLFCYDNFYVSHPNFWNQLAAGNFQSGQFERKNSSGSSIWLEATYNPISGTDGKVYKVIKFASDITHRVNTANSAAEAAASTSEETSQITTNAKLVLQEAVETSTLISEQVNHAAQVIDQLNNRAQTLLK